MFDMFLGTSVGWLTKSITGLAKSVALALAAGWLALAEQSSVCPSHHQDC